MSQTVIFSCGLIVFGLTVWGAVMAGGIWAGGIAESEDDRMRPRPVSADYGSNEPAPTTIDRPVAEH